MTRASAPIKIGKAFGADEPTGAKPVGCCLATHGTMVLDLAGGWHPVVMLGGNGGRPVAHAPSMARIK